MGNTDSQDRLYDPVSDKQWSSEVFHKAKEVWLELLLSAAGKVVKSKEVQQALKAKYPLLCDDQIRDRSYPQIPYWQHLVGTAISDLKRLGKARRADGGWVAGGPTIPPKAPSAVDIPLIVRQAMERGQQPSPVSPNRHEQLKQAMVEIGKQLGYHAETEKSAVYRHDVIWQENPYTEPSYVIEICEGGSLPKDFDALHWAIETWRKGKGILVVTDDKDFAKARNRFAGRPNIAVVKADTVEQQHKVAQDNPEFLRLIFGKEGVV